MKGLYKVLLLSSVFLFTQAGAQNNFWNDAPESTMKNPSQKRLIIPNKFRSLALDTLQLKQFLRTAPMEFSEAARSSAPIMSIPMPDGSVSHFNIVESPIMEPGLAAKFPNIKTYSGQGIEDRTATIKIDWTELGFHAMIFSAVTPSISIDPYSLGDRKNYISYSKADLTYRPFVEKAVEEAVQNQAEQQRTFAGFCFGTQLRSYRLAMAAAGEYTAFFGGTVAAGLSAVVTTVNRVDGVYEKEVAVRLVLVANNNAIIFTDATTDPFVPNMVAGVPQVDNTLLNQTQTAIDTYIGSFNYDIGHLVTTIDGGGLAQRPSVCISGKARGATGLAAPSGDSYDIDYVAHEVGHQFGGNHTFNAGTGSCAGTTRNGPTSVEPGSGVTIMAYAGICGSTNDVAAHSIPYFHTISQGEIGNNLTTGLSSGCAVITSTGNAAPVVNAGADYSIPASTPFVLTGSATDANGDALTYSWEEIDPGTTANNWNSGSTPFFRSFAPKLSGTRYFPQLSDVASGTSTIGEYMPFNTQLLNFRLTARDNRNGGGGVCSDEMVLNVIAGPAFSVSSQTTATTWTANGTNTATITWNVANTTGAPFNTANVTILFSADGGLTFPYTLVASTANDGSETIVIPAVGTLQGRVMIKSIGNVFFNVNTANIAVSVTSCTAEGAVIAPTTNVSAPAGSGSLNLSLSPQFSNPISITGTLISTDPSSNLTTFNTGGVGCQAFANPFKYQLFTFFVSQSGSYTFTRAGGTSSSIMLGLYGGSYNPVSTCTNFLSSNGTFTGTAISVANFITVTLTANTTYVLAVGTFSSTAPALPSTYTINITTGTGGSAYAGSSFYSNPGAGFSYSYVIVDNTTNTIKAISSSANLSTAGTYPNGTSYTVYGVSFNTSHTATLNSYVGLSFTALTNGIINNPSAFCASLSKNTVNVMVQAAVPVTFLGLKARKQAKKVLLEWSTASEINSDYFDLQRSADGTNFTTALGRLGAAGTSTSVKNYSILDAQPLSNWNYYRVKQVDKDGKVAYSNIAPINFEKAVSVVIVYPNPAKDKLTIEYTATKAGNVQLQVLDSKGSLVLSNTSNMTVGRNTNTVNISTLSKGVYMLRSMDTDGNVNFVKFIKE